jgi:hypothetical protein
MRFKALRENLNLIHQEHLTGNIISKDWDYSQAPPPMVPTN